MFALPSVGSGRPAGLEDTGVVGTAVHPLNDGNMPQRKPVTIAEPRCEPCLLPAGKRGVPTPANEPSGVLERGSWRRGGGSALLKRTRGTHHRSRSAVRRAELDALPQMRGTTAPSGRHSRTQVTRSRLCRRWLSSSWPTPHAHAATLCDRPNRDRVGRLGWVELHHDRNLFVPD